MQNLYFQGAKSPKQPREKKIKEEKKKLKKKKKLNINISRSTPGFTNSKYLQNTETFLEQDCLQLISVDTMESYYNLI